MAGAVLYITMGTLCLQERNNSRPDSLHTVSTALGSLAIITGKPVEIRSWVNKTNIFVGITFLLDSATTVGRFSTNKSS